MGSEVPDVHTEYRQQDTHQKEKSALVDVLDTDEHQQGEYHEDSGPIHPHIIKHC